MPVTCGLWLRRHYLVAVVLDSDRSTAPLRVPRSEDGRRELLAHLTACHGRDCALVATEALFRLEPIGELALRNDLTVWAVPQLLAEAIRDTTGLAAGPPKRSALMLARLPLHPFFRPQLRHYLPARDPRQLPLL